MAIVQEARWLRPAKLFARLRVARSLSTIPPCSSNSPVWRSASLSWSSTAASPTSSFSMRRCSPRPPGSVGCLYPCPPKPRRSAPSTSSSGYSWCCWNSGAYGRRFRRHSSQHSYRRCIHRVDFCSGHYRSNRLRCRLALIFFAATFAAAQSTSKPLTIEAIFAEGGVTGRTPENLRWSPDGKRLTYILRDDPGERAELYSVDLASGKANVLVGADKMNLLAPPDSKIKDERRREWRTRYKVASYHWSPDSKQILFDAQGQLWLYTLFNGVGVRISSTADPSLDPKFSPDGKRISFVRKHNLMVQNRGESFQLPLTRDQDENVLNGEVDWVYAEEL